MLSSLNVHLERVMEHQIGLRQKRSSSSIKIAFGGLLQTLRLTLHLHIHLHLQMTEQFVNTELH